MQLRRVEVTAGIEVVEALVLAAVALMTAWSSYQAALWNSRSAADYGRASGLGINAQAASTRSGQEMLYDAATFNQWLIAIQDGKTQTAAFLEERFRPEYRVAFDAWLKTDPLHNPAAPAGPAAMPEYRNASADKSDALAAQARAAYDRAGHDRDLADSYIRVTVVLAIVLLLTALSQRFRDKRVRAGVVILAVAALTYALYLVATVAA